MGVTYLLSVNMFRHQAERYNRNLLSVFSKQMDALLNQVDRFSFFAYQPDVAEIFHSPPPSPALRAHQNSVLELRFETWKTFLNFDFIVSHAYYLKDQESLFEIPYRSFPEKDFSSLPWYQDTMEAMGQCCYYLPQQISEIPNGPDTNDSAFRFIVARRIFAPTEHSQDGVFLLDIVIPDMDVLLNTMDPENNFQFFISDAEGNCLYAIGPSSSSPLFVPGESISRESLEQKAHNRYLINVFTSSEKHWNYVILTNSWQLTRPVRNLSLLIFFLGLLLSSLCVIKSRTFINRILFALQELTVGMNHIIDNNFGGRIPIEEENEIRDLKIAFNTMAERMDYLVNCVYKEQLKEKQAKLNALQSQINPHFLYNTLGTISAMAVLSNTPDIGKMADSLADMFRYAIKQQDKLVPLRLEFENLSHYIQIQKYRYGRRLAFYSQVPPEDMSCLLLCFTLQPLVENAILHGLEPRPGGGFVRVSSLRTDTSLTVTVEDNGVGIPKEKLHQLRQQMEDCRRASDLNSSHIGLLNVCERLFLYYGDNASLHIDSQKAKGTVISITVPCSTGQLAQNEKHITP